MWSKRPSSADALLGAGEGFADLGQGEREFLLGRLGLGQTRHEFILLRRLEVGLLDRRDNGIAVVALRSEGGRGADRPGERCDSSEVSRFGCTGSSPSCALWNAASLAAAEAPMLETFSWTTASASSGATVCARSAAVGSHGPRVPTTAR
jgi:hypothetical protein